VRIAASDACKGRPVQLTWSREEDVQHDFYRPRTRHRLQGALGANGLPSVWTHRIAAPSIALSATPMQLENDVDPIVTEGAVELPYVITHRKVQYVRCEVGMRVGFWRSVGWSANSFAVESFVDELAHAAGRDPCEYRRALLASKPRHLAVLDRVARAADWTKPPAAGRHRGLAFAEEEGSLCAQVAEIAVAQDGCITVHRIVCALDCGTIVNPALVREQVVGATLFGMSATLYEAITVDQGRIAQSNFDGYRLLRMSEAPDVEVHLIDSTAPPTGVGEIATSPISAAVCNAFFAATGRRVRSLPVQPAARSA
jgi:isoquinoline 1-oxidoreductase subunit beta